MREPESSFSDVYWDVDTTGESNSAAGTGLSTSEMQGSSASSNMSGFDFSSTWDLEIIQYSKI